MSRPLRILQLVGSPESQSYCDLSELYARASLAGLHDPTRYEFVIAHIAPDGMWRFPDSLAPEAVAAAPVYPFAETMARLTAGRFDAAVPQLFCRSGMTNLRSLLELLGIPYLGNRPLQMAVAADKNLAKTIVAAAGVHTPSAQLVRPGDVVRIRAPAVVKPNTADNSEGVTLVTEENDFAAAIEIAFSHAETVLVEAYIALGREVRCGVVMRADELVCLPLEEYYVDPQTRPIRRLADKLKRTENGELFLGAKTKSESWIVPLHDPIVPAVHAAARRAFIALDSRQYNLFDFRIDDQGRPWFLEAGPYCSFAPQSVIVTMSEAAGTPLQALFAQALDDLLPTVEPVNARNPI